MTINRYAAGDRITARAFLSVNDAAYPLPTDTILAALVSASGGRATGTADVTGTLVSQTTGEVSAVFPAASTGAIVPGRYLVEFQVTRSGEPETFRTSPDIEIYAGVIP